LLVDLPLFTAPPSVIDSITIHRSADGVHSLVGSSWPHIVAFSMELLRSSALLSIDGSSIAIAFSNAAATYRAFARDYNGDVVAELVESEVR
jgi:hypothetical protein